MSTAGTSNLVSSTDVNGTPVYGQDGSHIGTIDHLMIDKASGRVAYAVMGFGGLFGLGEEHYPVPWSKLSYDTAQDGFQTDLTKPEVEGAPRHAPGWHEDRDWEQRLHEHYGARMYWL